jgi:hypothetical protein
MKLTRAQARYLQNPAATRLDPLQHLLKLLVTEELLGRRDPDHVNSTPLSILLDFS